MPSNSWSDVVPWHVLKLSELLQVALVTATGPPDIGQEGLTAQRLARGRKLKNSKNEAKNTIGDKIITYRFYFFVLANYFR